jgi:regulator of sirC expression with transglutaminase-like and TPR domain
MSVSTKRFGSAAILAFIVGMECVGSIDLSAAATPTTRQSKLLNEMLAIESAHPELCASALDEPTARARLRKLAEDVQDQLVALSASLDTAGLGDIPNHRAESMVRLINGIVFGPVGVRSSQDLHDPCNLLLSGVLSRRQGYCVGIAAVYLALAEQLDLPIHAVATPTHVFLRYDDGTTRINIETFDGGAPVSDDQYTTQNRIAPVSVEKGVFLQDLSTDRFLAQIHNNLGVIYSERQEFDRARLEYETALHLDGRMPAAWYNSGKDLQQKGQLEKAVRAFSKALHLHPNDTWALNNRAMAYRDLGRPSKARHDLEEALRIEPGFEQARSNLVALPEHD